MIPVVRRDSIKVLLLGLCVMPVVLFVACGQQQSPSLAFDKPQALRTESEGVAAKSLTSARSSSEESGPSAAAVKLQVFAKKPEPLTLQRGGSVKIAIPLSDQIVSTGLIKSIDFQSAGDFLKGSVVQGRILSLVVSEDAVEGRYESRIIVKLGNGSEASQSLSVAIIP